MTSLTYAIGVPILYSPRYVGFLGMFMSNASSREKQVEFYQEHLDSEIETARPRGYPLPARFLFDFKLQNAIQPLDGKFDSGRALVLCCGSGMDAEFLARRGMQVMAMDMSFAALLRAKERAERYGVTYQLVLGDAENLPFKDAAFELVFVHDGLHHLPDAYRGVREMLRVASEAVVIAEPADATLTKLAVKLRISEDYEDAGNFVYRLNPEKVAQVFAEHGVKQWTFERHLIYYQPWTFRVYRFFELKPMFWLFKMGFYLFNWLFGRWGNSLKAVGWKTDHSGEI